MPNHIVGSIEGYDVIYVSEKDIIFCKNTSVAYDKMRAILINRECDRGQIKNDLVVSVCDNSVALGCLTTTLDNCSKINKEIKKIKRWEKK